MSSETIWNLTHVCLWLFFSDKCIHVFIDKFIHVCQFIHTCHTKDHQTCSVKQSETSWISAFGSCVFSARKASWISAGVGPVHQKLARIDPGSGVSGTNRQRTLVLSQWNKSDKRQHTGCGYKSASKTLLLRLFEGSLFAIGSCVFTFAFGS